MNKWIFIIFSIILGEIVFVLLSYTAQEILLDSIRWQTSSWEVLILGSLLTLLAAIGAGMIARWSSKENFPIVPRFLSLLILIETSWLIAKEITGDPIWFDILAGLGLILGIWLGYLFPMKKSIK